MGRDWLAEDRAERALDRIVTAAGDAYADLGVGATMAEIAGYAGCSRATLYRYFSDRRSLQEAYLDRATIAVAEAVAERLEPVTDPEARLVEAVIAALEEVRSTPTLAVWFWPENMAVALELSRRSEVVEAVAARFFADGVDPAASLRARWVVRTIISLLLMPGADEAEERQLLADFLAPAVMAPSQARR